MVKPPEEPLPSLPALLKARALKESILQDASPKRQAALPCSSHSSDDCTSSYSLTTATATSSGNNVKLRGWGKKHSMEAVTPFHNKPNLCSCRAHR